MRRLGWVVVTFFVFLSFTYFLMQAMPGSIADKFIANPKIPLAARQALIHQFGLDQPVWLQYLHYLWNFLHGNLGVSFSQYPRPVWSILMERLPRTVMLFLSATVISFYIGFAAGKVSAWRRATLYDYTATIVGATFFTAFYPLLGLVVVWLFGFELGWFPLNQFIDPYVWIDAGVSSNAVFAGLIYTCIAWCLLSMGAAWLIKARVRRRSTQKALRRWVPVALAVVAVVVWAAGANAKYVWDIVRHMVLPIATLTLISFAGTMLVMRDSMLETIKEDYVMAARAKGLPERIVRDRYAARTALLPVVTGLALSIGGVMSGGLVTETIFSWPGLGLTLFDAAIGQDYPLAMGAFAFTGIFILLAHLAADLLYAWLDPRISYDSGARKAA
ncbi:MAG TPA: ABC transporter permease [Limnochordia bacterium]|nr:ABC transporter permease [Limnochordia bacterium]